MEPWIQTHSGRRFWPLNPSPQDVDLEDIAHALSHKCRYAGHIRLFYSVAEHSVIVSKFVPPQFAVEALLHDAEEAYSPFGDIPRPIKIVLPPQVLEINDKIQAAVHHRFGLPVGPMSAEVKAIDNAILADEMRDLMAVQRHDWKLPAPPLGIDLSYPSTPGMAKMMFMERAKQLGLV